MESVDKFLKHVSPKAITRKSYRNSLDHLFTFMAQRKVPIIAVTPEDMRCYEQFLLSKYKISSTNLLFVLLVLILDG